MPERRPVSMLFQVGIDKDGVYAHGFVGRSAGDRKPFCRWSLADVELGDDVIELFRQISTISDARPK